MRQEEGIIIKKASHGRAWVETVRTSACEGCASKGSCHASGKSMEVCAINDAGADIGDRVLVSIGTGTLIKMSLLAYIFPVFALMAGAAAGNTLGPGHGINPSLAAGIGGFGALAVSFVIIRLFEGKIAQGETYTPRITRILPGAPLA
ncbi:SoxR reducing system RseC family protein [Desulfoluna spongiiphila]|uniref:Positive regulator of sigma(E), RseC/MucC n=1 Tax=Desulfoluna spongiiphila TaxID=419481 RepID=A0A1G5GM63_9BACT|nr:SoxR reducing system RseC family protein [Desulfoluna spongiiphila]SCY52666.1 positive regulator of sigma(E), RseC/MucC [Desulfoluna spongiiphila]VVS92779.1 positive regulator of sigma(e) rsec/mucc [Desulfoluna spongiiphila]